MGNLWKNLVGFFTKCPVGKFWSNLWKNSVGSFTKCLMGKVWSDLWKNPQVSYKICLIGTLMGFLWSHSQLTQRSHWDQSGGLFLNELSIHPLGKVWVNCLRSLKKPSIYPLGKTPSAPSDIWLVTRFPKHDTRGIGNAVEDLRQRWTWIRSRT